MIEQKSGLLSRKKLWAVSLVRFLYHLLMLHPQIIGSSVVLSCELF